MSKNDQLLPGPEGRNKNIDFRQSKNGDRGLFNGCG